MCMSGITIDVRRVDEEEISVSSLAPTHTEVEVEFGDVVNVRMMQGQAQELQDSLQIQ